MTDAIFFWLAPTVLVVFAAAFALIAYQDEHMPSARWAALGFTVAFVSLLTDTLRGPTNLALMATATALHWPALAAITNAFLVRHEQRLPVLPLVIIFACGLSMLVYTTFIDRNPNLGVANANLVGAAVQALALPALIRRRVRLLDHLIFALILFAVVCYSVRAGLFLPQDVGAIETPAGFWSLYNLTFYMTTGFVSLASAVLLLIALGSDMIHRQYIASGTDLLTGLANRRAFETWIDEARDGVTSYGAVVMIDLDHFKRINDTHGHAAGDDVLAGAAAALSEALAGRGHIARVGGEEFAVLVFAPTVVAGARIAEDLRAALSDLRFDFLARGVTGSFGVAGVTRQKIRAAMREADRAVYAAKNQGRNRVVLAEAALVSADYHAVVAAE